MNTRSFKNIVSVLCLVSIAAWAAPSISAEAEDIIKYRQGVMKSVGGHTAAAGQIVRGKVDYMDDLGYHVESIARSLQTVESLFPQGSDFGETRALEAIWSKGNEFKQASEKSRTAAAALLDSVKANDKGAYAERFEALGESCKACHKDFRKKKE